MGRGRHSSVLLFQILLFLSKIILGLEIRSLLDVVNILFVKLALELAVLHQFIYKGEK